VTSQRAARSLGPGQLRLLGALVAGGTPAVLAVGVGLADVPLWPFALLGVVPGVVLGAIFGPTAARTDKPVAAAFLVGLVGWFVGIAADLGSLLLVGQIVAATSASSSSELTSWQQIAWL